MGRIDIGKVVAVTVCPPGDRRRTMEADARSERLVDRSWLLGHADDPDLRIIDCASSYAYGAHGLHRAVLFALVVSALVSCSQTSAKQTPAATASPSSASLSVSISDPRGDIIVEDPSFMDIVGAEVSRRGDAFTFSYQLAGKVPTDPKILGTAPFGWAFCIDTDLTTEPAGYPFGPGTSAPCEFALSREWNGHRFATQLIDRRPLLQHQDATVSPLDVIQRGARFEFSKASADLGSPSSFSWHMASFDVSMGEISDVDQVPDDGLEMPARWPSK